jgi:hypothetical protein
MTNPQMRPWARIRIFPDAVEERCILTGNPRQTEMFAAGRFGILPLCRAL